MPIVEYLDELTSLHVLPKQTFWKPLLVEYISFISICAVVVKPRCIAIRDLLVMLAQGILNPVFVSSLSRCLGLVYMNLHLL